MGKTLPLMWIKRWTGSGPRWFDLLRLDLDAPLLDSMAGVYYGGPNPSTIRVGHGEIRTRLATDREDPEIQSLHRYGLGVTWARVEASLQEGVSKYLTRRLQPKPGDDSPDWWRLQSICRGEKNPHAPFTEIFRPVAASGTITGCERKPCAAHGCIILGSRDYPCHRSPAERRGLCRITRTRGFKSWQLSVRCGRGTTELLSKVVFRRLIQAAA